MLELHNYLMNSEMVGVIPGWINPWLDQALVGSIPGWINP